MARILYFPLSTRFPDVPFSVLETVLSPYEWETYAVGLRVEVESKKPYWLKVIRARFSAHSFFAGKKISFEYPDVEIILDEIESKIKIQIQPVVITGRYTKLSRVVAQTKHFCYACKGKGTKNNSVCPVCMGKKVLTKESVQELISPFFVRHFDCDEVFFHGAGREDVDVRMLGTGRPFALTLENPKKRMVNMQIVQQEINASLKNKIGLVDLHIGFPTDVAKITQSYHTKRYRALVESKEKIESENLFSFLNQKIDVFQTTPLRVEKRRVMKERPHWIILEKVIPLDEKHIEIVLHSSQGCCIKEFVSGDEGRTQPSISNWLKVPCICKELDVLEIVDQD